MTTKTFFDDDLTLDDVKEFIDAGSDVNAVSVFGLTPLFYTKSAEIAELLVKHGANIEFKAWTGRTAIFHAHIDVLNVLVTYGADINIRDNSGYTALNHSYYPIYLIKNGAVPVDTRTFDEFRQLFTLDQQKAFDAYALISSGAATRLSHVKRKNHR